MRAQANPLSTDRVLLARYMPRGWDWEELARRLESLGFRAAVVGPRGSGKTTLLEDLEALLRTKGIETGFLRLNDAKRKPERREWRALRAAPGLVWLVDGAEQLGWLDWRRLLWTTRRARGLVVSSHRPGLLPTLVDCRGELETLLVILDRLCPNLRADWKALAGPLLERHQGNIREVLREYYDMFADLPAEDSDNPHIRDPIRPKTD
jgi:energy-coupling factor transporter ATP-binding protein EcfA2